MQNQTDSSSATSTVASTVGSTPTTQIEQVDISDLTAELFYQNYQKKNRPVIITGALEEVKDWSIDLMRKKLSEGTFTVRCYGPDHFKKPKSEWSQYCNFQEMTIDTYTDQLLNGHARDNNHYLAQVAIGETPLADVLRQSIERLAEHCGMERATDMGLWLGPTGHTEPLHWDSAEGTVLMLHGAKRVSLIPPEQSKNLYRFPFNSPAAPWISQVYVDNPDYDAFPKLRQAIDTKIELTLEKGQILYIPALWWHELSSVGDDCYTCSVNRFWKVKPLRKLAKNKLSIPLYSIQTLMVSIAKVINRFSSKSD